MTEDPTHATALYEASMTHLQLVHYDEALSMVNEMLKRNSSITPRAYVVKSTALEKKGKPTEAISVAQEGLKRYASISGYRTIKRK